MPTPMLPLTSPGNMPFLDHLPFQVTTSQMAKYTAARLHPYVEIVIQHMCLQFRIGPIGRQNMERATSALKVVGGLRDSLELGFRPDDIIHSLISTNSCAIGVFLCAALIECYPESVAIDVLQEMAKRQQIKYEYMPPASAWREWLHFCSGLLAATDFPILAENLMRHGSQYLGLARDIQDPLPSQIRSCSDPSSIAECLFILGSTTRGEISQPHLFGGTDTGWLAAVAEWLLDLRIAIIQLDGNMFTSDYLGFGPYQGCVIFKHTAEPEKRSPIVMQITPSPSAVDASSRVFSLGNISSNCDLRNQVDRAVSGRMLWTEVLANTFQTDFQALMEIPDLFGELLGCAARTFMAVNEAESVLDDECEPKVRLLGITYGDTSSGSGLINTILKWFPELRTLQKFMEQGNGYDFDTANKQWELILQKLRDSYCRCQTCLFHISSSTSVGGSSEFKNNQDFSRAKLAQNSSSTHFCLLLVSQTIIYIARILSIVDLDIHFLFPMRSGFEYIYQRQKGYSIEYQTTPENIGLSHPESGLQRSSGMYDLDYGPAQFWLTSVLTLFAGPNELDLEMKPKSAICHNGIVTYLGVLQETFRDGNAIGRVHVIPGRIYHEKRTYPALLDVSLRNESSIFNIAGQIAVSPLNWHHVNLYFHDTAHGLEVLLNFGSHTYVSDGSVFPSIQAAPTKLTDALISRQKLVPCKWARQQYKGIAPAQPNCQKERSKSRISLPEVAVIWIDKTRQAIFGNKKITLIRPATTAAALAALAALVSSLEIDWSYCLFIVTSECLQCCIERIDNIKERPWLTEYCILYLPVE